MKKINLLFEKIDNYIIRKNLKAKFLKFIKILFPIFSGLILIIFSSILLFAKYGIGIGTSGVYECYYTDVSNENKIYTKLTVGLDNKCTLILYIDNGIVLDEPIIKDYYWSIRYAKVAPEDHDERIPFSNFQFSFENANGGSMFQYSYFPEENKMVTKVYSPFFSDGLVILKKV